MQNPAKTAKKLLRLAKTGKGWEKERAAERAREIMQIYRLREEDVGAAEDEDDVRLSLGTYSERHYFAQELALAIARNKDCEAGWFGNELVVVGPATAAKSAAALYATLLQEVASACAIAIEEARPAPPPAFDPFDAWQQEAIDAWRNPTRPRALLSAASAPSSPPETFDAAFAKLFYANFAEAVVERLAGRPKVPPPVPGMQPPGAFKPGAEELTASIRKDVDGLSPEERAALGAAIARGRQAGATARLAPPLKQLPESLYALVEAHQKKIRAAKSRVDALLARIDRLDDQLAVLERTLA